MSSSTYFFYIWTSKFWRGSLFLIFWLFQLQFISNSVILFITWAVWNDEKSKQKDKALKNIVDCLHFENIFTFFSLILSLFFKLFLTFV